jgi:hypothetical protein
LQMKTLTKHIHALALLLVFILDFIDCSRICSYTFIALLPYHFISPYSKIHSSISCFIDTLVVLISRHFPPQHFPERISNIAACIFRAFYAGSYSKHDMHFLRLRSQYSSIFGVIRRKMDRLTFSRYACISWFSGAPGDPVLK